MKLKLASLTLAILGMILVPVSSQALPACGSWGIVPSPNAHPLDNDNVLSDVTAVAPSNVWAVGKQSYAYDSAPESTLAEHWDGTAWKVVGTPNAKDLAFGSRINVGNRLNAVTAVSVDNVWAVGAHATSRDYDLPSRNLVERWNGAAWNIVASPNVGAGANELQGIVALSASDVWAVGSYADGAADGLHDRPLTLHWNGTAWKGVAVPSYGTSSHLLAVAKIPGTSRLWAVGDYVTVDPNTGTRVYGALIEKWNGSSWSVAAHTTGYERLKSVTAISSSSAFAVGNSFMRWNGTKWSVMPNAVPGELEAVTRAPNGNLWAAGWSNAVSDYSTLIERWDGSTWSVVPSPNRGSRSRLYGIVKEPTSASSRVWAVGYSSDTSPWRTLVETYC